MNKIIKIKHDIYGDIMFYFIINVLVCLFILLSIYTLFNRKEITILEILILLFILNICIFTLYNSINIFYTIILSLLVLVVYYFYNFLYNKELTKKIIDDKVLINRGIINFKELINANYSYDGLLYNLRKRGINNPNQIDYCIKRGNELIIFKKNSIKNYPISLIIDGKIIKDNLFSINKSIEWLEKRISDNNLELNNINYAYFKNKEVYFITN